MKIKEVIKELKEILDQEGDLEVFCTSDHGQDYEGVYDVGVSYYVEQGDEIVLFCIEEMDEYESWEIKRGVFIN